VVYDDLFTTVPNAESGGLFRDEPFDAATWEQVVQSGLERVIDADDERDGQRLPQLADEWLTPQEQQERQQRLQPVRQQQQQQPLPAPERGTREARGGIPAPEGAVRVDQPPPEPMPVIHEDDGTHDNPPEQLKQVPPTPVRRHQPPTPRRLSRTPEPTPVTTTTRSGRQVKPPQRLIESMLANTDFEEDPCAYKNPKRKIRASGLNAQFLLGLQWAEAVETIRSADLRAMMTLIEQHTDLDNKTVEWLHPLYLSAKANSADNPTWNEAMNGPDKAGYWEACKKEISTLADSKDAWDVVDREDWMNVLPSTWAFKCKRFPDGTV
jgi:hypothetical protein